MIEWIEFKNFKALRNAKLPLSRFTLIVGANGSGKSTALQGILALRHPGQWQFTAVRSAGVADSASVTIASKWTEQRNEFLINVEWSQGYSNGNGPAFRPHGTPHSGNETSPRMALDRSRVFTLDANSIAAPVYLHPRMELAHTGANLAGVLDRLRDQNPSDLNC